MEPWLLVLLWVLGAVLLGGLLALVIVDGFKKVCQCDMCRQMKKWRDR